jgi:hypothetical protein
VNQFAPTNTELLLLYAGFDPGGPERVQSISEIQAIHPNEEITMASRDKNKPKSRHRTHTVKPQNKPQPPLFKNPLPSAAQETGKTEKQDTAEPRRTGPAGA